MEYPYDMAQTRFIEALTRHQPALGAFFCARVARQEDAREVLQDNPFLPLSEPIFSPAHAHQPGKAIFLTIGIAVRKG